MYTIMYRVYSAKRPYWDLALAPLSEALKIAEKISNAKEHEWEDIIVESQYKENNFKRTYTNGRIQ